jgi:hypothetical protein
MSQKLLIAISKVAEEENEKAGRRRPAGKS